MRISLTLAILTGILALLLVFPGCNRAGSSMNGSGKIIDQDVEVADFTRIAAQGAFTLDISQADSFLVTISTDDNLISRIQILREDETLKLAIQAPANFFPTSLKVKIQMPRIYGLKLSQGARSSLSGFKSTFNFDLEMSEESLLTGILDAGNCVFNISKSSQVSLAGSALSLSLEGSEGSKASLAEFPVNSAHIFLKGKSEASLNINGRIDIRLEEASRLYYLGNPTFSDTSISSDSVMQHR